MHNKRFIHSFSTRPMLLNVLYGFDSLHRLAGNIIYFALSVAYMKRNGYPIALHTDSLGAALLGYLPYDEIILSLDDMPDDIYPRFWAAGKFWAMEAEGPGSVHIDGDVFIKKEKLAHDILYNDCDVIVQYYEKADWYKPEIDLFSPIKEDIKSIGVDLDIYGAYCTGVIGINNEAIHNEYISRYKAIALTASNKIHDRLETALNATPDLISEQANLYQLCEQKGASVHEILPQSSYGEYNILATDIGYQHVLTATKFNVLDKAMDTLKKIDYEIYLKTEKLCRNILTKLQ